MKTEKKSIRYFVKTLSIVVGLVLVWRGVWHALDGIDEFFFGGYDIWTSIVGIIVGVLLLYLPDGDLKEIEKL